MTAFGSPFEYLDLANDQTISMTVERIEQGTFTFDASGRTKTVTGLRVYLSQAAQPQKYRTGLSGDLRGQAIGSSHIDIGQTRLTAELLPLLSSIIPHQTVINLRAHGYKPAKYYELWFS